MMELIIVTGMAGAGKTSALNAMEDIGYYVVDNLPLALLRPFVRQCLEQPERFSRTAIVMDIRSCERYAELSEDVSDLRREMSGRILCRMLCLEASDQVLVTRFRTSRRSHPLAKRFEGDLGRAIAYEREHLQPLRAAADIMMDSSLLTASQLKDQIKNLFMPHITDAMTIQVMSFGFKYGSPMEADLVFDMRCLPNPYYVDELREHTGVEACVQEYVMQADESKEYYDKVTKMLDFLIPLYIQEGRPQLVVAFGCTGGQHRSVTFAELVSEYLRQQEIPLITLHRDYKKHKH